MKKLNLFFSILIIGMLVLQPVLSFAGATFSAIRAGNWTEEILTPADLNAEFLNILNNFDPYGMNDYSATVGQMQTVTDPYPGSVEALATSLQGELERMRYVLKQLGRSQWYIDPYGQTTLIANATLTADNYMVLVNGTATLTLPSASSMANKQFLIKSINTNTVTIDANASETIDGSLTTSITNQYDTVGLFSNGVSWQKTITPISSSTLGGLRDSYRNLAITNTTNLIVNTTVSELIMQDSNNNTYKAYSANDMRASLLNAGAFGLDTGTVTNSAWYHVWGIHNTVSPAIMFSASSTSPTMPSSYNYKAYLGAIYNTPTSGLRATYQRDKRVVIPSTTALNSAAVTSYTALSLSSIIPPTATHITGTVVNIYAYSDMFYVYLASKQSGLGELVFQQDLVNAELNKLYWPFGLSIVETQTLYWYSQTGTTVIITISGWEY